MAYRLLLADQPAEPRPTHNPTLNCALPLSNARRTSVQDRYFLTSHTDVVKVAYAVRAHWAIENGLRWTLDIAFDEDQNRARIDNAQANLVTVRHLALSLLKQEKSEKVGIKAKRKLAGWDDNYLLKVLDV